MIFIPWKTKITMNLTPPKDEVLERSLSLPTDASHVINTKTISTKLHSILLIFAITSRKLTRPAINATLLNIPKHIQSTPFAYKEVLHTIAYESLIPT